MLRALLLAALLVSLVPQALAAPEGRSVELREGERAYWTMRAGSYALALHNPDETPARVNLTEMGIREPVLVPPNGSLLREVGYPAQQPQYVTVLEGRVHALMAHVGRFEGRSDVVEGQVVPAVCRAHLAHLPLGVGEARVQMRGEGAKLAVLSLNLTALHEGESLLDARVDPRQEDTVLLQVCAQGGTRSYRLAVQPGDGRDEVPAPGLVALLAVLAFTARRARAPPRG